MIEKARKEVGRRKKKREEKKKYKKRKKKRKKMIICNRGSSLIRICCISSMRQRTLQIPRREENIVGVVIPVRSMTTSNCDTSDMVVPKEEVVRFIEECLCKVGTLKEDAHVVACHLMTSDYRGHFSHGMNRMQMYVNDIKNKIIDPVAKPNVIRDFKVRTNFFFFLYHTKR